MTCKRRLYPDEWYPVLCLVESDDAAVYGEKEMEFTDEEMARIRRAQSEWRDVQMMIAGKFGVSDHNSWIKWEIERIEEKRNMTKEEMITGLKHGLALVVDRKDAPELPELLELEKQGLVVSELVEYDEQSSALKFRWKK